MSGEGDTMPIRMINSLPDAMIIPPVPKCPHCGHPVQHHKITGCVFPQCTCKAHNKPLMNTLSDEAKELWK